MATKSDSETPSSGSEERGSGVRERAADAYEAARDRTYSAYESARSRASDFGRQASEQASVYPVAAVAGGLVVGALIGFLLPTSRREKELLGNTGKRITGAAREAAQRGLDAGKEQIEQIRANAAQKVGEAVSEAVADAVAGNGGKK